MSVSAARQPSGSDQVRPGKTCRIISSACASDVFHIVSAAEMQPLVVFRCRLSL